MGVYRGWLNLEPTLNIRPRSNTVIGRVQPYKVNNNVCIRRNDHTRECSGNIFIAYV